MDYNKIIISLVVILVAFAIGGFVLLNQTPNTSTNIVNNPPNNTTITNTTVEHINHDDTSNNDQKSSQNTQNTIDYSSVKNTGLSEEDFQKTLQLCQKQGFSPELAQARVDGYAKSLGTYTG
jgi:predicted PurR-regulated permease PerM